jgi:predicted Zn-dependent peptidase
MIAVRRHATVTGILAGAAIAALAAARLDAQDLPARPPAAGPLRPVQFPPFQEARLSNGVDLLVVENHEQPTVSVSLTFRAGSAYEAAAKTGLAGLVAELLTKGTKTRSAEQIAATIEGAGGSIGAGADDDFLTITSGVLTDHADLAFELLGDVVRNATFPEAEVELARTRAVSEYQLALSQPEAVADWFFAAEVYGTHPYGRHATADTYRAITRDDVVRFAGERLRPTGALLVVAGDITLARAHDLANRAFDGWRGTAATTPTLPMAATRRATDILLVHRPGSVQANIVLGNTTMLPGDTNYFAARLATQVLGGGPDARLFLILREQKSWTYGAYASMQRRRELGAWQATAEVRTEVTDSALREMLTQLDRIRTELVPDSELVNVKGFLVGAFPLTIETPSDVASQVAMVRRLGLPRDYLQTYRDRLAGVSATRARQAAARYYRRDSLTIVVVGDAVPLHPLLAAILPVRLVDLDGKPLTAADLAPRAGPVALDRAQIVTRADSFNVVIQGGVLGSQVWEVTARPDSLVLRKRLTIAAAGLNQETTVVFDPRAATVRQVDQTGGVQGQTSSAHLTWDGEQVKGTSTTPQPSGTPKSITIDTTVAPGTVDDDALPVVIPALPLDAGKTIALGVFSSAEGKVEVLTIKVGAPEQVTVPAGTFEAYRLDIAGGQVPYVFHVTTATPRRIVRIEFVGRPFVFELVK